MNNWAGGIQQCENLKKKCSVQGASKTIFDENFYILYFLYFDFQGLL